MASTSHTTSLERIGVDSTLGRRPLFVANHALRNGTSTAGQILGRAASGGRWDAAELVHRLALLGKYGQDSDLAASLHPWAAVQLARLLGTQNHAPSDAYAAVLLLRAVRSAHGPAELKHDGRLLLLELLAQRGETDEELEGWIRTLRRNAEQLAIQVDLLRANAANPFRTGTRAPDAAAWESSVARVFETDGLEPISPRSGDSHALGRLSADSPASAVPGPLVTIVVTADDEWTPTTVRSVLGQSHRSLEVLVTAVPGAVAAEAWDVDDTRVRRITVDGSTSAVHARNLAVADHACGDLVTIAHGDDWLHPRRIERQVARLAAEPEEVACLVRVLPATDDLMFGRTTPDAHFVQPGAGTLLVRRAAFDEAGYWDVGAPERLADRELVARLAAVTGRAVPCVGRAPLTLTRYTPTSRGPHFVEPRARWYTSAYPTWHETATPEELRLPTGPTARPELPTPPAIATDRAVEADIAYVTDFRFAGGNSSISANEIQILDKAGYRVAMVHLESPVLGHDMHLHPRALAAARLPGTLLATIDHVVDVRLTIVRHPTVLQLADPRRSAITTGSLAVIVNHAPYEADLGGSPYDAAVVAANASTIFGTTPVIYPESGLVHHLLDGMLDPRLVADESWTGVLPSSPSRQSPRRPARRRLTGRPRPVIGRHSRDSHAKWPDAEVLRAVYPVDGSWDVRVLGGAAKARQRTGIDVESIWTVYPFGSRPVGEFLDELDFWVYVHGPELYESFGMAIVEALAAGLVVVLPRHLEPTFGDAAVYAEPDEVLPLVERLWRDPAAYAAQSERAIAAAAREFGPEALVQRVARIMDDTPLLSSLHPLGDRTDALPQGPRRVIPG
jgi:hypothetical protein